MRVTQRTNSIHQQERRLRVASLARAEPFVAPRIDIPARERLIVALDVGTVEEAERLVATLGDSVSFYKIGMQLQFGGGIAYARDLVDRGKRVFLDSKLFDIDETIERAVENVAAMGVDFLTVHGNGKTIPAAVRGKAGTKLKIFSVTVLTSLDNFDMADLYGEGRTVEEVVMHRARAAYQAGADGVIASGQEAQLIRDLVDGQIRIVDSSGPQDRADFHIITPGIRPTGGATGDQKRVTTPAEAIRAGADYLVVGRPVYRADDPRGMAERIVAEIEAAL